MARNGRTRDRSVRKFPEITPFYTFVSNCVFEQFEISKRNVFLPDVALAHCSLADNSEIVKKVTLACPIISWSLNFTYFGLDWALTQSVCPIIV